MLISVAFLACPHTSPSFVTAAVVDTGYPALKDLCLVSMRMGMSGDNPGWHQLGSTSGTNTRVLTRKSKSDQIEGVFLRGESGGNLSQGIYNSIPCPVNEGLGK